MVAAHTWQKRFYILALSLSCLFGTIFCQQQLAASRLEPVSFQTPREEGSHEMLTRKGLLTLRPGAKATLLICHGYMCDKHDISFLRTFFPDYNVMVFDFRAHGEHDPSEECTLGKEEANDVLSAAHYLKSRPELQNQKLFAYGFSMGAASLIEAQAKEPIFDALVLDCPFDSSENIVRRGLTKLKFNIFGYEFDMPGKRILEKYAFNPYVQPVLKAFFKTIAKMESGVVNTRALPISPVNSAKKITAPCFFIHCVNDEKVPVKAVKGIYDNTQGPKRLWLTSGRHHYDSIFYCPEEYGRRVNEFYDQVLSGFIATSSRRQIIASDEATNYVTQRARPKKF